MPKRQSQPRHPAQRQPDIAAPVDPECIPEPDHVGHQVIEFVVAFGAAAVAMPAGVVAEHPETVRERRNLRIPHGEVRGQRIAEGEPRRVFGAVDPVVERDAVDVGLGHRVLP